MIYFGFTREVFEVEEDDRDARVCLELTNAEAPIEDAVWLGLATEDDSALSKIKCSMTTGIQGVWPLFTLINSWNWTQWGRGGGGGGGGGVGG